MDGIINTASTQASLPTVEYLSDVCQICNWFIDNVTDLDTSTEFNHTPHFKF